MTVVWPFGELAPLSFDLIMADPPWSFDNYSKKGELKNPKAHYRCMTLSEIVALPVQQLAANDCWLWLWATHPMLPEALRTIELWGFRYVTSGVWVKKHKSGKLAFGTGYVLRSASEPFLIAKLGNPLRPPPIIRTVLEAAPREHSRKPEIAYTTARILARGASSRVPRMAELFSRESREGWSTWGDEASKFDQQEVAAS